jgi:acyl-CoA thioester hydrolase
MGDAAGTLDGATHVFPVRVYYEDTDAGGVVYYANYLKFAERARTDLLRVLGLEQSRLAAEEAIVFAVRRCSVDYLRPARLDDQLQVHTRLLGLGGATLDVEQRILRAGVELVRMRVSVASVRPAGRGRPVRIPATLRAALAQLVN